MAASPVIFQSTTPSTPPAATQVAADDVSGVKYQVVKLDVGAAGASTPVSGALPVSGSVSAQIVNGASVADVVTGGVTGGKGLRVFIQGSDPVSDLPVFVDYNHHQNHEGEAFQYTYPLTALASGSTLFFRLVVPTYAVLINSPHLWFEVDVLAQTTISLYESPTTTANGTLKSTYCRNRNSANTPGMTVYLSPTVTANGTLLSQHTVGDATVGAAMATFDEWLLKSNTVYLIGVLSSAASNSVGVRLKWYEDLGV